MSIKITKNNDGYKITFDDGNRPEYFTNKYKDELDERVRELKEEGYTVENDHRI